MIAVDLLGYPNTSMTRRQRAYVPKVKGCYECARRRIDCDRGDPGCQKCATKGIHCSGYGVRYRFTTGTKPSDKQEKKSLQCNRHSSGRSNEYESRNYFEGIQAQPSPFHSYAGISGTGTTQTNSDSRNHEDTAEVSPQQYICQRELSNNQDLCKVSFGSIEPWSQSLLLYFSENIAPILVMIDDQYNGWRRLVLPLAHMDEMVRDAVITVSAFAFSAHVNDQPVESNVFYERVIRRLRQKQDFSAQDRFGKQRVLLSLLLLLAGAIVNGSSDFRTIFRLMESFLEAVEDKMILEEDELGSFLLQQVLKFRGFASPFMSRREAVAVLSQTTSVRPPSSKGWAEFLSLCESYPNLSDSMSLFYELSQKACSVYLGRLSAGSGGPSLSRQVEDFKVTLNQFPVNSPGEHNLVWSVFIVALESTTADQRQFFTDFLLRQHKRTGFANIAKALECLKTKWKKEICHDWTQDLTSLDVFVV